MNKVQQTLKKALAPYIDQHHLWVGYSGGLDSHVLLDAAAKLAREQGGTLSAIHVNHKLNDQADSWAEHCRAQCAKLGVHCKVINVNAQPEKGESPEAKAREARYRAISNELGPMDLLLLAQHQDDQLETFFLQLLRGAGPAGLSAMPELSQRLQVQQLRPFLELSREVLEGYAQTEELKWVEDDSNQDTRFDRNYLRQALVPLLKQRWPEAAKTIRRAARHQANAQLLLDDLARSDITELQIELTDSIKVELLRELPEERQKNCLRYWLKQNQCVMPSEKKLKTLVQHLGRDTGKHEIKFSNRVIRKYRDELFLFEEKDYKVADEYLWSHGEEFYLPCVEKKLSRNVLREMKVEASEQSLTVKFRQGGERFLIKGRQGSRTLKKFFQEKGIPHWQRQQVPLIYHQSKLVAVYGYCACE